MFKRSILFRTLAAVLVVSLQIVTVSLAASETPAALAGSILSADGQAPIVDARLHVADARSGKLFSSAPTGADGSFTLNDLPPATYELAIESGARLYVVGAPLQLAPGQTRAVNLEVASNVADDPETAVKKSKSKAGSKVWNRPAIAASIIIAGAVVVGVGIDALTDEDNPNSQDPPASAYFPGK